MYYIIEHQDKGVFTYMARDRVTNEYRPEFTHLIGREESWKFVSMSNAMRHLHRMPQAAQDRCSIWRAPRVATGEWTKVWPNPRPEGVVT